MVASARTFAAVCFAIRVFILVLGIVAMILILTAPGACFSRYLNGTPISREICPGQNSYFPMNAERWGSGLHFQGRGENVYGQVGIIVASLLLALASLGFSCVHLALSNALVYPQMFFAALATVGFFVMGGFETWYATGFDHMAFFIQAIGNGVLSGCVGIPGCQVEFVVKGWAVAAAFYFLSAILYIVDMGITFAGRQGATADSYPVTTTRARSQIHY